MSRVVSFGSVNVDRIVPTSDLPLDGGEWLPSPDETVRVDAVPEAVADAVEATHLGGKGANAAVAAARAGAETTLVGMVGADAGDHGVRDRLEERGVDARLETVDAPTGAAYVLVDPDGGNRIALLPGANGAVDPAFARERAPLAREADVLLLQNEVPRAANVELLDALDGAARPTVVFDPAPAAGADAVLSHDAVDVVTPNRAEWAALDAASFEGTVVRTRGADDVLVERPDGRSFAVSPPTVDPVDTTGAGDAFDGHLAAALAGGADPEPAVEVAAVAGAMATGRAGAGDAAPTAAEVAAFAARRGSSLPAPPFGGQP